MSSLTVVSRTGPGTEKDTHVLYIHEHRQEGQRKMRPVIDLKKTRYKQNPVS